jgi:hypothetical protein
MNQHSIILLLVLVIVILTIYLAINHSGGEQFRRSCIPGTSNMDNAKCRSKYGGSYWNSSMNCCDLSFD